MKGVIQVLVGLVVGLAIAAPSARTETNDSKDDSALLWTFKGNYKMSPSPTIYSDALRIKLEKVEVLKGPREETLTKITYKPAYGKMDQESFDFRRKHETQSCVLIVAGDYSGKIKEGDLLRMCFYPN